MTKRQYLCLDIANMLFSFSLSGGANPQNNKNIKHKRPLL